VGAWDTLAALTRGPDGFSFADMADYAQRRMLLRGLIGFVVAPIVLAPFAWQWMRQADRDANSPCRLIVDEAWLAGQGLAAAETHFSASEGACSARWETADRRLEVSWTDLLGDFEERRISLGKTLQDADDRIDIADAPAALWTDHALVNVRGKAIEVSTRGPVDVEEAAEVVVKGARKLRF
jgi:hypothetical protein